MLDIYSSLASKTSPIQTKMIHDTVNGTDTFLAMKVFGDNEMAEYVLGSKIFRWQNAVFSAPPPSWALMYADVIDPKAKVPATSSELRSKYIENIVKLVSTQVKVAKYIVEVGTSPKTAEEENLNERSDGQGDVFNNDAFFIREMFPKLHLSEGVIQFDTEKAKAIPVDEDIRCRSDLWTSKITTLKYYGLCSSSFVFYSQLGQFEYVILSEKAVSQADRCHTEGSFSCIHSFYS